MINGLVDTTSIIHLYRRILPAYQWIATQSIPLGVVSTTWFEVLIGAKNKHQQTACIGILQQFTRCYLTEADQHDDSRKTKRIWTSTCHSNTENETTYSVIHTVSRDGFRK